MFADRARWRAEDIGNYAGARMKADLRLADDFSLDLTFWSIAAPAVALV